MNLEDFPEVPAHVRMIVWLGLEKHQEDWTNREQTEGDFCVYAETVEAFHFHRVDLIFLSLRAYLARLVVVDLSLKLTVRERVDQLCSDI